MPAPIYCYGDTPPPPVARSVEQNEAEFRTAYPPPAAQAPLTDISGHCKLGTSHWQLLTAPIPKAQSYESYVAEQRYRSDPAAKSITDADSYKRMTSPSEWNSARGVG